MTVVRIGTFALMAKTEIQIVSGYHANDRNAEKGQMIRCELFGCQKEKANSEQGDRFQGVMMPAISVRQ